MQKELYIIPCLYVMQYGSIRFKVIVGNCVFYRDLTLDNNNKCEGEWVEVRGVDLEEAETFQGGEEEQLLDWGLTSSLVQEAVELLNDG